MAMLIYLGYKEINPAETFNPAVTDVIGNIHNG
jgi:hypothetical protein